MAPHADDESKPQTSVPLEPGLSVEAAKAKPKMKMTFLKPPTFEDPYVARKHQKGKLAAAFRIFAKYGFDEGVAGHITMRDPVDPSTFWVNPFGTAFGLMKASDLIQVNHDGKVIDGGENRMLNSAAFMIHGAVHRARPDVMCAAHSHSIYGRTMCTLGRKLDVLTQDSCAFYEDHVLYESFKGVVLAEEEGNNIAEALGPCKAALLQNHGLLTVGHSIEEAVYWFVSLERCCHTQLMADAAAGGRGGKPVSIEHEDAAYTRETVGSHVAGYFSAKPLFDVIHQESNGDYLL